VGTLRIGVVTSALGEPLLTTIREFQRHRPQVQTQVVEVDTPAGSLVTCDSPHKPLIKEFLRIALAQPHDTA
jgi:hypothetical protein